MAYSETALENFAEGFNCAQSVFAAFSEKYALPRESALRIAGGFGGGMRSGEICGAVSGAVMVIGLRYGQTASGDREAKALCGEKTREFLNAFKEKHGSIICRELLGYDVSTQEGKKTGEERDPSKSTCKSLIADAADTLAGLGY